MKHQDKKNESPTGNRKEIFLRHLVMGEKSLLSSVTNPDASFLTLSLKLTNEYTFRGSNGVVNPSSDINL